jgi:hypothetical protein
MAARVQAWLGNVGFVVDKAALEQVFFKYFCFPCHSFHQIFHTHHHPSSGTGTIGQVDSVSPQPKKNYITVFIAETRLKNFCMEIYILEIRQQSFHITQLTYTATC